MIGVIAVGGTGLGLLLLALWNPARPAKSGPAVLVELDEGELTTRSGKHPLASSDEQAASDRLDDAWIGEEAWSSGNDWF